MFEQWVKQMSLVRNRRLLWCCLRWKHTWFHLVRCSWLFGYRSSPQISLNKVVIASITEKRFIKCLGIAHFAYFIIAVSCVCESAVFFDETAAKIALYQIILGLFDYRRKFVVFHSDLDWIFWQCFDACQFTFFLALGLFYLKCTESTNDRQLLTWLFFFYLSIIRLHFLRFKLTDNWSRFSFPGIAANDTLFYEGLISWALAAKWKIFAMLHFFKGEYLATTETKLEKILELLSVIVFETIITKFHTVLQLKVNIWAKLESAIDAILLKKGLNL